MAILNYTTEVPITRSIQEITTLLVKKECCSISYEYEGAEPSGIGFTIMLDGAPLKIMLPRNAEGVYKALVDAKVEGRYRSMDHAKRVSWRILKDWIEAQLGMVEANQADLAQVFLPYAVDDTGVTAYRRFRASRQLALKGSTDGSD